MKRVLLLFSLLALFLFAGCGSANENSVASDSKAEAFPETSIASGSKLSIYCFEAEEADAFLLYTENSAVLIDTGETSLGKTIVKKLKEVGIESLDYLIITHFDQDHVGGASKVLKNLDVKNVLQTYCPKDSKEYENYLKAVDQNNITPVTVQNDINITLDGVTYLVNPPLRNHYATKENNNSSLIVSVTNGQNRLLFLGDAEDTRLQEFISTNPSTFDCIKMPHHGRWHELLPELLDNTQPKYALVTAAQPEPATAECLTSHQTEVFCTGEHSVEIHSDGSTLTIWET